MSYRHFARFIISSMTDTKLKDIAAVSDNLRFVENVMKESFANKPENVKGSKLPRLVAVSKLQPKQAIIEAYKSNQRYFGENYVQELVDKASDEEIREKCPDIKFHFIGHLQKSNVNKLLSVVDKIHVIETIDSELLASHLNEAMKKKRIERPVSIFVQVNTSGEDSKSGVQPGEVVQLVNHILKNCPMLQLHGLMTIGSYECSTSDDPTNEEFQLLYDLREKVYEQVNLEGLDSFTQNGYLELSMGMSHDFQQAILQGSTNVRVGSKLFGDRLQSKPTV